MKQLLLRVDDEVHARLRERARREHRSINAIVGDLLRVSVTVDPDSPQDRVRARAAALGVLAPRVTPEPGQEARDRSRKRVDIDEVVQLTAGWGPQVDRIFAEDRDRV